MKIGVFDSGMGGLNVLKELLKVYPNNEYIYYGDIKNLPYGNKSYNELLDIAQNIINFFERKRVDLIIIACGTISSTCFKDLVKITNIPLLDIISPTINYLNKSNYHNIGLIATTRTIESEVFNQRLKNKNVLSLKTPSFVPIIEKNEIDKNEFFIQNELSIFKEKVECLVLGCTHYPLLENIIKDYLDIPLIDMGKCFVQEIKLSNNGNRKIDLYFTLLNDQVLDNVYKIIPSYSNISLIS